MVSFYFSCFLCDRSSRWDSELCAQLPWKPNPRGDWAPVGGRSRRTKRRGSCQGRPDSSRYIGLQRLDVHFGRNTGARLREIPACSKRGTGQKWNLHYSRHFSWCRWFCSGSFLFLKWAWFNRWKFKLKVLCIHKTSKVRVEPQKRNKHTKQFESHPSFGLVPSLAFVLTHRHQISIQRTYFFLFWCSSPVCS